MAADFFTTEVWTLRGVVTYYTLFVIELKSRRVHLAGLTPHPDDEFMRQVARSLTDAGDGVLLRHRLLICDRDTKWAALIAELRRVEDEQSRFVAAIAKGGHIDALARALQEREQQRTRLQQELAALDRLAHLSHFDARHIEKNLRGRLKEWRQLLHRHMPLSRRAISCLLDGRIGWTPRRKEGRYEFTGRVKLDRLLSGFVVTQGMASPMPASWNHVASWLYQVDGLRRAA